MTEPQEVTDRRWRFNLIGAVEHIAGTSKLIDLLDAELIEGFFDCVSDDCSPHGKGAMTPDEYAATQKLCQALVAICEKARLIKRERIGGKVVHGLEPDDLIALGWFREVQPLARTAFDIFMLRGEMTEGLWKTET